MRKERATMILGDQGMKLRRVTDAIDIPLNEEKEKKTIV